MSNAAEVTAGLNRQGVLASGGVSSIAALTLLARQAHALQAPSAEGGAANGEMDAASLPPEQARLIQACAQSLSVQRVTYAEQPIVQLCCTRTETCQPA